jgi:hypothetical protein
MLFADLNRNDSGDLRRTRRLLCHCEGTASCPLVLSLFSEQPACFYCPEVFWCQLGPSVLHIHHFIY